MQNARESGYSLMSSAARTRTKSPDALRLQRAQLDARLREFPSIDTPRGGWIRTIRQSLGMTMQQLGKRLGISPQSVLELERREHEETISVGRLRQAAEALNCDLRIVLLPRPSLEETVRRQALLKVREERNQLLHTMRLEAQHEGLEDSANEARAVEEWLAERTRSLWA